MRVRHRIGELLSVTLIIFAGCTGQHSYQHLPTTEQELYRAYSQVMTPAQSKTYLSLSTVAEREAFARDIGVAQKLDALSPEERQAVLYGDVFKGMSGQALRFVWGDPCREEGPPAHRKWYYHGPVFSLPQAGWNCSGDVDTITEVQLVNGKVEWWAERIPQRRRGRVGGRGGY